MKATDSAGAAKNYSAKPQNKSEQLKEIAKKERGAQNSLSREKEALGKEEKTTPKKEKVSPKKTEVGAVKINLDVLVEFAGK